MSDQKFTTHPTANGTMLKSTITKKLTAYKILCLRWSIKHLRENEIVNSNIQRTSNGDVRDHGGGNKYA